MSDGDLGVDLAAMWRDLSYEAAVNLRRHGLCDLGTPARVLGCPPIGIAKATREGNRFILDPAGRDVFVTPERRNGETVDLVAFSLANPDQPATLRDLTPMLGEEIVDRQLYVDGVTSLWESPLSWLRSGCDGGVILDWNRVPHILAGGQVLCETVDLARRVRMLFERPVDGPKLLVRQSDAVAA